MTKVSILLFTALICMLCSCEQNQKMANVNPAAETSVTSVNTDDNYPLYRLSEHIYTDEKYVEAINDDYSQEELKAINKRYKQLLQQHPECASVPRSALLETFSIYDDESESVYFVFCLGGYPTSCRFDFMTTSDDYDGQWYIIEDSFSKFYQCGMTLSNVRDIKQLLAEQIQSQIDQRKLENNNNIADQIYIRWKEIDGKCCACTEYLANVISDTTKIFGCDDQVSLNAMVYID